MSMFNRVKKVVSSVASTAQSVANTAQSVVQKTGNITSGTIRQQTGCVSYISIPVTFLTDENFIQLKLSNDKDIQIKKFKTPNASYIINLLASIHEYKPADKCSIKKNTLTLENTISNNTYYVIAIESNVFTNKFSNNDKNKIYLPMYLQYIGENAFSDNTGINTILFNNNKANSYKADKLFFDVSAFENCTNLTTFTTNKCITWELGNNCFKDCGNLENMDFFAEYVLIGNNCFENCKKLKYARMIHNFQSIGDNAFLNCELLENINKPIVEDVGEDYNIVPEYDISNQSKKKSKTSNNADTISNSINIGNNAFENCIKLKEFKFKRDKPKTLEFGNNAFEKCKALKTFDLKNIIRLSLGKKCFNECIELQIFRFESDSIEKIPEECFLNCIKLEVIKIKKTVKEISIYAFNGCDLLLYLDVENGTDIKEYIDKFFKGEISADEKIINKLKKIIAYYSEPKLSELLKIQEKENNYSLLLKQSESANKTKNLEYSNPDNESSDNESSDNDFFSASSNENNENHTGGAKQTLLSNGIKYFASLFNLKSNAVDAGTYTENNSENNAENNAEQLFQELKNNKKLTELLMKSLNFKGLLTGNDLQKYSKIHNYLIFGLLLFSDCDKIDIKNIVEISLKLVNFRELIKKKVSNRESSSSELSESSELSKSSKPSSSSESSSNATNNPSNFLEVLMETFIINEKFLDKLVENNLTYNDIYNFLRKKNINKADDIIKLEMEHLDKDNKDNKDNTIILLLKHFFGLDKEINQGLLGFQGPLLLEGPNPNPKKNNLSSNIMPSRKEASKIIGNTQRVKVGPFKVAQKTANKLTSATSTAKGFLKFVGDPLQKIYRITTEDISRDFIINLIKTANTKFKNKRLPSLTLKQPIIPGFYDQDIEKIQYYIDKYKLKVGEKWDNSWTIEQILKNPDILYSQEGNLKRGGYNKTIKKNKKIYKKTKKYIKSHYKLKKTKAKTNISRTKKYTK